MASKPHRPSFFFTSLRPHFATASRRFTYAISVVVLTTMTDSSLTHLRGFGDSISKLVAKTVSTIRDIIHPSTITVEVSKGTDHRQLVPLLWDRLQNVSVDPDLFLNYEGEPKPGEDVDEATQFYLQKLFKEAGVERYNAEVLARYVCYNY